MIPSNFASVTIALRQLLQTVMPPKVEVSTLPPGQAEKFVKLGGLLARVNLVCYQIAPSPNLRNISLARLDPSVHTEPQSTPLNLSYLVTVYGTSVPDEEQSTERLLESVYRAIEQKPILTSADLESALPGPSGTPRTFSARITPQPLGVSDLHQLFTSMAAVYRPSLAYTAALASEK